MINFIWKGILFLLVIGLVSCGPELPEEVVVEYDQLPNELDFNMHVKPILSDKCYACHGPDKAKQKAGLQLDIAETAYAELPETPGKFAIKPGNLKQSQVFHRIISTNNEMMMPPPEFNIKLSNYEKAVLIKWIGNGAQYKPHWAFIKPEKQKIPKVKNEKFVKNSIDNFILEMNSFLNDDTENAYEKQVDRLLGSIHYAEKMATDWMDVSRYADTYGYQVDRYRNMSPWRDWVIQSFHENRPYDQFLTWQLAGDLLPNATSKQILATGFNRLHSQNMEDGIIGEEYRVEHVSDRVAVLGDGIMGLTVSCAKCHDHKYDPISQKNYYEIYSFFNTINETGQISWDQATPPPTLTLPTKQQEVLLSNFKNQIKEQTQALAKISKEEGEAIKAWLEKVNLENFTKSIPQKGLVGHYSLDNKLTNRIAPSQKPKMAREFSPKEMPKFNTGHIGQGLQLDGDAWLECKEVGIYKRSEPFSIGIWVNIPKETKEGVIFHKNKGTTLHSYRGYHLYLKDNQLEWVMARTMPENAIIKRTVSEIPKGEWVQLTLTYDGSSTAAGTKIFMNGKVAETIVEKDNLTRDIVFNYLEDIIYAQPIEPNLQIGARWRGVGLKNAIVDDVLVYDRALTGIEVLQIAKPTSFSLAEKTITEFSKEHKKELDEYYLTHFSERYQKALYELKTMRTAYVDSMENVQEVMVMKEMETPRKTYVLGRGVYDNYEEEVFPNTPESVMPMPTNLPKNRLGLAQWLTHKDHPLTARVAVNRYWQNYFGRGLVKTSQDFGNQGELPSHPELLDWLALEFMESGWDVKALQKQIVLSATYRQSSIADEKIAERDHENKWLARGPNIRLTSEMMRDNALSASGLLNRKVGGESVYPYQPKGLWAMNFDPYPQDKGDKLYRRSLYTMWRRTIPNPTLSTFDQPDRNLCTVKRQKTNTPLQALVLLNDPTFVEAAKVIGENMTRIESPTESIKMAYSKLTGKIPNEKEVALLLDLREKEYKIFAKHPEKAKGWLATGEYKIDESLDTNLIAANAIVASVILNSDATITKR